MPPGCKIFGAQIHCTIVRYLCKKQKTMKHVFQIVFYYDRFDWRFDDYVQETTYGPLYSTKEAAEKHKAWYYSKGGDGKCVIEEIAIRDDFVPKK